MKRILVAVLQAAVGYFIGFVLGYVLVSTLSANSHDRDIEAAMTGAFVAGPLLALIALVIGAARGQRR